MNKKRFFGFFQSHICGLLSRLSSVSDKRLSQCMRLILVLCKNHGCLAEFLHHLHQLIYSFFNRENIYILHIYSQASIGRLQAVKRRGPSGSFLPWAAAPAPWHKPTTGEKSVNQPEIVVKPTGSRSYDGREDQRASRGGVRGSARRLLHLLRQEKTEWPQLQEQAARTWVLTSSSSSSSPSSGPGAPIRPGVVRFGSVRFGVLACRFRLSVLLA